MLEIGADQRPSQPALGKKRKPNCIAFDDIGCSDGESVDRCFGDIIVDSWDQDKDDVDIMISSLCRLQ